jgi:hypothetical protein
MKASQSEGMPKGSSDGLAVSWLSSAHSPGNDFFFSSFNSPDKGSLLIFYFLQEGMLILSSMLCIMTNFHHCENLTSYNIFFISFSIPNIKKIKK